MPVPKTPAADDTSESKSNPDVVSASPKLEVISASKFAAVSYTHLTLPTNREV